MTDTLTTSTGLTRTQRRALLGPVQGSAFDPYQRVFGAYEDGMVFDYGEFDAADIATMLKRDGKARATFEVLTLPLRSAKWKLDPDDGDAGQLKLVEDTLGERLGGIIDQMTTAVAFTRAFFACSWKLGDGALAGKIVHDDIELRPATGCEAGFDPKTGKPRGFRQRIVPVAGIFPSGNYDSVTPGYTIVKLARAFVYCHGAYRDPIKGVSDLDVAYWSWQTKQKILFLLFQFLENQSLPKTVVYGDDIDQAGELAQDVATLKSSGVLGLPRPTEPGAKAFDVLESSGLGAAQFMDVIRYLDTMMVSSVLAGFTELAATSNAGSYALSADQSEFFLASRQAVADEMADAIREGLFRPLIANNYGPDAPVPKITIGPLSNRTTERALSLLTAVVAAPSLNIPTGFVDQLTQSVASYLGLDDAAVKAAIEAKVAERAQADKLKLAQQQQLLTHPIPQNGPPKGAAAVASPMAKPASGAGVATPPDRAAAPAGAPTPKAPTPKTPTPPKVAGAGVVKMARTVDVAADLVAAVRDGAEPAAALAWLFEPDPTDYLEP